MYNNLVIEEFEILAFYLNLQCVMLFMEMVNHDIEMLTAEHSDQGIVTELG